MIYLDLGPTAFNEIKPDYQILSVAGCTPKQASRAQQHTQCDTLARILPHRDAT
jgi:hypothetical protein